MQAGKLMVRPYIPLLKENNVRKGFFEPDQFRSVWNQLPVHMQPIVGFAFITGWRTPSEILTLEWRQVDMKAGEVRLDAGTTKNGEGRHIGRGGGFQDHRHSPSFRLKIARIRAVPGSLAHGPAKCHLKCHAVRHRGGYFVRSMPGAGAGRRAGISTSAR